MPFQSDAVELEYKGAFVVVGCLHASVFLVIMPAIEYVLIRHFEFTCASPGQWALKLLCGLPGAAPLGSIELYSFFQVVFCGSIGEYRPRKKF